ncbi:MAG: hypothetical protein ABEJ79_11635 [Halolamina sp.]
MRRRRLLGALLVGKVLDAVSTVVVLRLEPTAREVVPLARWSMATFGAVGGMAALTAVTVVAVAVVAESGALVEHALPEVTPSGYADRVRTGVYAATAVWFAAVGVHNASLLL